MYLNYEVYYVYTWHHTNEEESWTLQDWALRYTLNSSIVRVLKFLEEFENCYLCFKYEVLRTLGTVHASFSDSPPNVKDIPL